MKTTEAICFSPPSFGLAYFLSDSISLGSCNIQFTRKVRDLGFWLDSYLTTKQHYIKICQSAYLELSRISFVRQYLTEKATKTLVTSCVLSRLDFCNSLLMGKAKSNHSTSANTSKLYCTTHFQIVKNLALYTSVVQTPVAAHNSAH